ncbi:MAG: MarR family transcriptional regulator [Clostridia bacterium]|nr:MarR family transcriptional regulator [Clostridia bacterium]
MADNETKTLPETCMLIGTLLATMRMHRKQADRFVRITGLHPTQHRVLMYLSRKSEPCKQRELSEHFELTPAAVVQILDKLEAEGYVQRQTSETDNRCKHVLLTEKGIETAKQSSASFRKLDARLIGNISEAELEVFYSVLLQMQENMKEEEVQA